MSQCPNSLNGYKLPGTYLCNSLVDLKVFGFLFSRGGNGAFTFIQPNYISDYYLLKCLTSDEHMSYTTKPRSKPGSI